MNVKQIAAVLTLAAASIALPAGTAHAQQQQPQQVQQQQGPGVVFAGDGLRFEVWGYDEAKGELGGYLVMGQNQYPFLGKVDFNTGQLSGKFAVAQGEEYPFTGQLTPDGNRMVFTTGGKTYNLTNEKVGQSTADNQPPDVNNPLDQAQQNTPPNPLDNPADNPIDNDSSGPAANAVTPDFETGVNAFEAGDTQLAYQHLAPLAEQGNADAATIVGIILHYGKGVDVDGKSAARYYKIAADQNQITALLNLGILYRDGIGVEKDGKLASEYLGRAANLGDPDAQLSYGHMYWTGELIEQDDAEAIAWWILASENGNTAARDNLTELRRSAAADVIKKADARAAELRKQVEKIAQLHADTQQQRAIDDIRNSAPASNLTAIEEAFKK